MVGNPQASPTSLPSSLPPLTALQASHPLYSSKAIDTYKSTSMFRVIIFQTGPFPQEQHVTGRACLHTVCVLPNMQPLPVTGRWEPSVGLAFVGYDLPGLGCGRA